MKIRGVWNIHPKITQLVLNTLAKIEAPIMDTAQSKAFINCLRKEWKNLQEEMYRFDTDDFDAHVREIRELIQTIVENRKNEVPFNLNTKTVEHETNIDNGMELLKKLDPMND